VAVEKNGDLNLSFTRSYLCVHDLN